MSVEYWCTFLTVDHERRSTEVRGIADVADGFWCNEHWQFTSGFDAEWWIPASRVIAVHKVRRDD